MFVRRAGGATFSMAGTAPVDERTFILNQGFANCYAPGTNYELVLTDSIRDISITRSHRSSSRSPRGVHHDVPPQVAFTILPMAVYVSPTADVTVVFNEAMDTNYCAQPSRLSDYGVRVRPRRLRLALDDTSPSTLPTATDLIAETDHASHSDRWNIAMRCRGSASTLSLASTTVS